MRKGEGFSLLEIVTVLALLGILAGVAVPKYYDLRSKAEKKAAEVAVSEAQVRINATYSKYIYAGLTCTDAVKTVSQLKLLADETGAKGARIGGFYFTAADETISADGTAVTLQSIESGTVYKDLAKLYVPSCIELEIEDADTSPVTPGDDTDDRGDTDVRGDTGVTGGEESGGATSTDGESSGGSSGSSSGVPSDFPTAAAWPATCQYCEAGTLLSYGGNYYAVTSFASFTDEEIQGNIESTTSFMSGAVVRLNFDEWPIKQYNAAYLAEVWNPALSPGSIVKNTSAGGYAVWTGPANTIASECPWVNSTNWLTLKGAVTQ